MAYCETSDVKLLLDISGTGDDTLIGGLITQAQEIIESYCHRQFEASTETTRYFDAVRDVDGLVLNLDEDLAQISTVTNGDSTVVTSAQYATEPRNRTPYHALRLLANSGVDWEYTTDPENAIAIKGYWAWSVSAPLDIKRACIRLAAQMYNQKDSGSDMDRPVMSPDGAMLFPAALPRDVIDILNRYRRL